MTASASFRRRLLERVPLWLRSRWPLARFYWQQETLDKIKDDAADLIEEFTGPSAAIAQKLYDTRANLRHSIYFHPLVVKQAGGLDIAAIDQGKCTVPNQAIPEYRRVFDSVVEFDEALEQWIRVGLIVTDVTPVETAVALKKAVKF